MFKTGNKTSIGHNVSGGPIHMWIATSWQYWQLRCACGDAQGMACRLMDWGGRVLAHPWRMRRRDRPHQLGLGVSLAFRIWLCYHHQSGMFFFASMTISESIVIAMISYLHLCGLLRHDSTGRTRFVNIIVLAAGIATKKIFKLSRPCCVTVIPNFH